MNLSSAMNREKKRKATGSFFSRALAYIRELVNRYDILKLAAGVQHRRPACQIRCFGESDKSQVALKVALS
jgi:hypothetical protein